MNLLEVYLYGSPILKRPTMKVGELPDHFPRFLEQMYAVMYNDDGIGLSANQVGVEQCFFIADFSLHDENMQREIFINPEIVESQGIATQEEGCLSIPGVHEKVKRAYKIKVRYEGLDRNPVEKEFEGFPARVIQHEVDHLNGILFVERISPLKRSFIESKLRRIAEKGKTQTEPIKI
ncbi:MAG: peptide deformylase [Candidatus Marinimicrobia bacterium]|nr:peptide deformylase [Candidatus Neomarinimicrobiota bacterium]